MNKTLALLLLSIMCFTLGAQLTHVQGKLMLQDGTPFIEVYIYAQGKNLSYVMEDGNYKKGISCTLSLVNGVDSINDRFNLTYQGVDSLSNFFDIRRYVLDKTDYTLVSTFDDLYNPSNEVLKTLQEIDYVSVKNDRISDIVLLKNFYQNEDHPTARNGLILEPLAFHTHSDMGNVLAAYVEFYNKENSAAYIEYGIEDLAGEKVLSSYKKIKADGVDPRILTLDLNEVDIGEYNFFVQSFDKEKAPIAKRKEYLKKTSNASDQPRDVHLTMEETFVGKFSEEDLNYYLNILLAVMPTNRQDLLNDAIISDDIKRKQLFLISFWSSLEPENPGSKFDEYNMLVNYVNERFDYAGLRGYQSERGHMYLKYGPPSDVIQMDNEVDALPYEIWLYNDFDVDEINIKFLFYNPSLVHNDYRLLHGTSRKERQNKGWHSILYSKAPTHSTRNIANGDGFGRFALQYFSDN